MKSTRLLLWLGASGLLIGLSGQIAHAQTVNTLVNVNAIPQLASTLSAWIRTIGYTAAVGTMIYAGILYINSKGGDATTAKNAIRAAITGLAIIILSEVIVRTTLGFVTLPNNQVGINAVLHNDATSR